MLSLQLVLKHNSMGRRRRLMAAEHGKQCGLKPKQMQIHRRLTICLASVSTLTICLAMRALAVVKKL